MASITIDGGTQFPESTTVSVYTRAAWSPDNLAGVPAGPAVTTATVTGGSAVISGLSDNTDYVAYAQVSGQNRFRRFSTWTSSSPATGDQVAGRAWQPNTVYKAGDVINQLGVLNAAKVDFTSGATFNQADWTLVGGAGSVAVQDDGVAVGTRGTVNATTRIQATDDAVGNRVVLKVVDEKLWLQEEGVTTTAVSGSADQQVAFQAALDKASTASKPVVSGLPGTYRINTGISRALQGYVVGGAGTPVFAGLHVPADVMVVAPGSPRSMRLQFDGAAIQTAADAASLTSAFMTQAESAYANSGLQGLNIESLASTDSTLQSRRIPPNLPHGVMSVSGALVDCNFSGNMKTGIAILGNHNYLERCRCSGWAAVAWIAGSMTFFDAHLIDIRMIGLHCSLWVEGNTNGWGGGRVGGVLFERCHFGLAPGPCIYYDNSAPAQQFSANTFIAGAKEGGGRGLIYDPNLNVQVVLNEFYMFNGQQTPDGRIADEPIPGHIVCGGYTQNRVTGVQPIIGAAGLDPVNGAVIQTGASGFMYNDLGNIYPALNMCRGVGRPFVTTTGRCIGNTFEYFNPGAIAGPRVRGRMMRVTSANRGQVLRLNHASGLESGSTSDSLATRYDSAPKPVAGVALMGSNNEIIPVATNGGVLARPTRLGAGAVGSTITWPLAATIGSTTLAEDLPVDPQEPPFLTGQLQVGQPATTSAAITLSDTAITIPTTAAPSGYAQANNGYGGYLSIAGNIVRWAGISGSSFTGCYLLAGPGGTIASGTTVNTAVVVTHQGGFPTTGGRFSVRSFIVNYTSLQTLTATDGVTTFNAFLGCTPDTTTGFASLVTGFPRVGRVAVLTDASSLPASGGVRFGTNVNCTFTAKSGNRLLNVHTNAAAQTVTTGTAAVGLAQITINAESVSEWKPLDGSAAFFTDPTRQCDYDAAIRNMYLVDSTGGLPQVLLVGITNGRASGIEANNTVAVGGDRLASSVTLPAATIPLTDITGALFPNAGKVSVGGQVVTYTGINVATNSLTGGSGGTGTFAAGTPVTPANNGAFVPADSYVRPSADTLTDVRNQGIVVAASSHVDPAAPAFAHGAVADNGGTVPLTLLGGP